MVFVRSICADLDHAKEYDLIGVVSDDDDDDDDAHMSIVDVSYLAEIRAKGAKWPHHKREKQRHREREREVFSLCLCDRRSHALGVGDGDERHKINQYA